MELTNVAFRATKILSTLKAELISWTDLIQDVPQGSVLGPLLFNITQIIYFIKLNRLKSVIFQVTQFFFACDKDLKTFTSRLEKDWKHVMSIKITIAPFNDLLKVGLSPSKNFFIVRFNDSPSKMIKMLFISP